MANSAINVVVSRKRPVVVTNHGTGGIIDTTTPVTIKNVPSLGAHISYDDLIDVNLSQRTDGSVPIYDKPTNTYVVKHLEFDEIDGNLDGGTF